MRRTNPPLAGQSVTAVGRTTDVTGTVAVGGGSVVTAQFVVDMRIVRSDSSRRDAQFAGRIMETDQHPQARSVPDRPVELNGLAASAGTASYSVGGQLTLRGVTKGVTALRDVARDGSQARIVGPDPPLSPTRYRQPEHRGRRQHRG